MSEPESESCEASVGWLLQVTDGLVRAAGQPIFESSRILEAREAHYLALTPCMGSTQHFVFTLFACLMDIVNDLRGESSVAQSAEALGKAFSAVRQASTISSNVPNFLKAALELGIPVRQLVGQTFQYGMGRKSRWLDSSFTDQTPLIGGRIARDKVVSAHLLRKAGIPVPDHILAKDLEEAVAAAEQLGYPVVVKPRNLDGGVGVAAGLTTRAELEAAVMNCLKSNRPMLVQKHFEGRDYRLNVFHGRMIWAIERVPGGVTGDGTSTVSELILQINADPWRGEGRHLPLSPITLDAEALDLLAKAGLSSEAVPEAGQFVRLRRIANIAAGGVPKAVFEQVHPDNRDLAIRAAGVLRLDLAGVDLLIPDIAISWLESGAVICEVNAQPNLGQMTSAHIYGEILKGLIEGEGRIPTIMVLGASQPAQLADAIESALAGHVAEIGRSDEMGVRVGSTFIRRGPVKPHEAGQMLACDPNVGAIILCINDFSLIQTGLPFDRVDLVIIAGSAFPFPERAEPDARHNLLESLLGFVLPVCGGRLIALEGCGLTLKRTQPDKNADVLPQVSLNDIGAMVQQAIVATS